MRRLAVLAFTLACSSSHRAPAEAPAPPPKVDPVAAALDGLTGDAMMADVTWLTAPGLRGRGSLTADAVATADKIAAAFAADGLRVVRQPIPDAPGQTNVIGILDGDDQAVVVCAHYDHLGEKEGVVYPGADDNASGTAVLLALARALHGLRGHTVILLASGAEEEGLLGAHAYVQAPVVPLDHTIAMVNFDMVGRNFFEVFLDMSNTFAVVGSESATSLSDAVTAASKAETANVVTVGASMLLTFGFDGYTDDYWFRQAGVPAAHFSTGRSRDYHQPTDTIDRLRPDQLQRVARVSFRVLVAVAGLR